MKLVGHLLLVVSLVVGVLGAATAYLVSLDFPDEELIGLTLNAPAGVKETEGQRQPLLKKKDSLDPGRLEQLREAGVAYVQVQEFSFQRWPGKWAFLVGLVGLGGAAVLLKRAARQQFAAGEVSKPGEGPEAALQELIQGVETLQRALPALAPAARLLQVRDHLDHLRQTHLEAFLEGRPQLIARLGLFGYAEVMDRFAAGERQIYRAWSAAADGIHEEMVDCLGQAIAYLKQARQRLT